MIRTAADFEAFKASALDWQRRLGLTDWTLHFRFDETTTESDRFANIQLHRTCRQAALTFYANLHPDGCLVPVPRQALHEVLHVLLCDVLAVTAARASDDHAEVVLAEHSAIERLLNALAPV